MKNIARKHHYIPQAYLAAFTDTESKDGQFYVIDVDNGNGFRTSPKNVAAQRDFNRVDVEGKPPDVLEQALSPVEERMVEACRNVNCNRTFPNDEDYNYIINLIGLLAIRNPKLRSSFNHARKRTMDMVSSMLVSDERIFDHHMKKAKEAGNLDESDNVSYKEMKKFVEEQNYEIEFLPEGNLRVEFHALDGLLRLLGERTWSLLLAPVPGPLFICSDHPVVLSKKISPRNVPIGYGTKNTEIFFPFGPNAGFYGVYEKPLPPELIIKPKNVAIMNRRMLENAERHVFSKMDRFIIWSKGNIDEINCGSTI